MATAVAEQVGVSKDLLTIELSSGSVVVNAKIDVSDPAVRTNVVNFLTTNSDFKDQLATKATQKAQTLKDNNPTFASVTTGTISVSVEEPVVQTPAPTSAPTIAPSPADASRASAAQLMWASAVAVLIGAMRVAATA